MTRGRTVLLAVTFLVMISITVASADFLNCWDPILDKWVQGPNMTDGLGTPSDAFAQQSNIRSLVADDFACTTPGPVDQVMWWGTFMTWDTSNPYGGTPINIEPDTPAAGNLQPDYWNIRFYSDVPAAPDPSSFSHPGELIREFTVTPDHYLCPVQGPVATVNGNYVYAYAVDLSWLQNSPNGDARFFQQGTAEDPVTYWISIQAGFQGPVVASWAWQETVREQGWNDTAVGYDFYGTDGDAIANWGRLADRPDMAFKLAAVPEPGTLALLTLGLFGGAARLRRRK